VAEKDGGTTRRIDARMIAAGVLTAIMTNFPDRLRAVIEDIADPESRN